jgi:hypothetical protein
MIYYGSINDWNQVKVWRPGAQRELRHGVAKRPPETGRPTTKNLVIRQKGFEIVTIVTGAISASLTR